MVTLLAADVQVDGFGFGGIATIVFGLVAAAVTFLVTYLTNSTRLMKRIDDLTTQVFTLQDRVTHCEQERGDLKAEALRLASKMLRLEKHSGMEESDLAEGVIVADLKGIIKVFSPTLTPLFRYLPGEVIGKPVGMLMSLEDRALHEMKLKAFADDPERTALDSTRIIFAYALNKHGDRIPVAITLTGWQVGKEGLITATIRERAVAKSNPEVPSGS